MTQPILNLTDELVLCINRQELYRAINPSYADDQIEFGMFDLNLEDLQSSQFEFLPRKVVDQKVNENVRGLYSMCTTLGSMFPQVLPYIIVLDEQGKVLSYARKVSSEARLLNSRSIGFGGHIEPVDYCESNSETEKGEVATFLPIATIKNAALRELQEELGLNKLLDDSELNGLSVAYTSILGKVNYTGHLIVDNRSDPDSNKTAVGSVHIALVHTVTLTDAEIKVISETSEAQEMKWLTWDELKEDYDMYESWSRILIDSHEF